MYVRVRKHASAGVRRRAGQDGVRGAGGPFLLYFLIAALLGREGGSL